MFLELDFGKILNALGPIVVAFVLFVVPIIKAVREASEKKRALEARGEPDHGRREREEEMRRKWDDLVRGESADAPTVTQVPPPIPVPARSAATMTSAPPPLFEERAAPYATLTPARSEDEEEASFQEVRADEERLAQELTERRLRDERARRERTRVSERSGGASRQSLVPSGFGPMARVDLESMGDERREVETAVVARRPNIFGVESSANRRDALRRAVVAREVLGAPLGLRSPDEARAAGF